MTRLTERNPALLLVGIFVFSCALLTVWRPDAAAALYVGCLALALMVGVSARALWTRQLPFVLFAVGLFTVNAVSRPGDPVWRWGWLTVTDNGMSVGAALALRTLTIGVLMVMFWTCTEPVTLTRALHDTLRVSHRVTDALLAGLRMLDDLPAEWDTIRRAQAVRSPRSRPGHAPRDPRSVGRAAFTLLVGAIRRGERIAVALESRGLGLPERTSWRPIRLTPADVVLLAVVVAISGAVVTFA